MIYEYIMKIPTTDDVLSEYLRQQTREKTGARRGTVIERCVWGGGDRERVNYNSKILNYVNFCYFFFLGVGFNLKCGIDIILTISERSFSHRPLTHAVFFTRLSFIYSGRTLIIIYFSCKETSICAIKQLSRVALTRSYTVVIKCNKEVGRNCQKM